MAIKKDSERALDAYKLHLNEASDLLLRAMHELEVRRENAKLGEITLGKAGSMKSVRETAVELVWKLGLITSEDARADYGVVL